MRKKYLGIDPGSQESGVVMIDYDEHRGAKQHKILLNEISDNLCLAVKLQQWLSENDPETLIIGCERIQSFGNNQNTNIIRTCEFIGEIRGICKAYGYYPRLIARKTLVTYFTGQATKGDKDIRLKMIDIFGKPGTMKSPGVTYGIKSHEWQALAVAKFCLDADIILAK